jgi:hypothetical protein
MQVIPLTTGGETRIDECDLGVVAGYRWRAQWRYRNGQRVGVSSVVAGSATKGTLILLHRVIARAPDGSMVDHVDGDPCNNTRGNLRLCTHAENMRNRAPNYASETGRKGVYVARETGKKTRFRARIQIGGRRINLGRFDSPEAAAAAYAAAAKKHHGEFARCT